MCLVGLVVYDTLARRRSDSPIREVRISVKGITRIVFLETIGKLLISSHPPTIIPRVVIRVKYVCNNAVKIAARTDRLFAINMSCILSASLTGAAAWVLSIKIACQVGGIDQAVPGVGVSPAGTIYDIVGKSE